MRIWVDVLTPKELVFFEPIAEKLGKRHRILYTSREYDEVTKLAKIRRSKITYVGRHGGGTKRGKLEASIDRIEKLTRKMKSFRPDLTVSFCSPEASRISFGLGIRHIAFCDAPHMEAQMRLTLPLIQHLLIPSAIPKEEFTKYGIPKKNITAYRAIDAALTIKRTIPGGRTPFKKKGRKNIVIRVEEEQAAYASKSNITVPIIKSMIAEFPDENVVVLGRYTDQVSRLKKRFGKKAHITKMSYDGRAILDATDIFIGSGGTMTTEAGLMGVPTISYYAVPNIMDDVLFKKRIIMRATDPKRILALVKRSFKEDHSGHKKRVKRYLDGMEDPMAKLYEMI